MYIDEIKTPSKSRRPIHPSQDPMFIIPNDEELMNSFGFAALYMSRSDINHYIADAAFERYWTDEQKAVLFAAVNTVSATNYVFSHEELVRALATSGNLSSNEAEQMFYDALALGHIEYVEGKKYKPDERPKRAMMPYDDWDREESTCKLAQEDHVHCARLISNALKGKDILENLTPKEQDGIIALLAKMAINRASMLKDDLRARELRLSVTGLTAEELRAFKILLARTDEREENHPITQGDQEQIWDLMCRARSPDGIAKEHLTSEQWERLGFLLCKKIQFEFSTESGLNVGDSMCIFTLLDSVCKSLEDSAAEPDAIIDSLFEARKAAF